MEFNFREKTNTTTLNHVYHRPASASSTDAFGESAREMYWLLLGRTL
jgi:hypothetical protein